MSGLWLDPLIDALINSTADGVPLVTWHGAAYDLACLAHHSGRYGYMRRVALASIDVHLLFMAVSRHRLGLKTAAERARDEALAQSQERLIRAEVTAQAAAMGFKYPGDIYRLAGLTAVNIEDGGAVVGVK